jgi:hypothetical protein
MPRRLPLWQNVKTLKYINWSKNFPGSSDFVIGFRTPSEKVRLCTLLFLQYNLRSDFNAAKSANKNSKQCLGLQRVQIEGKWRQTESRIFFRFLMTAIYWNGCQCASVCVNISASERIGTTVTECHAPLTQKDAASDVLSPIRVARFFLTHMPKRGKMYQITTTLPNDLNNIKLP